MKKSGWFGQSARHSLASRGIPTKSKGVRDIREMGENVAPPKGVETKLQHWEVDENNLDAIVKQFMEEWNVAHPQEINMGDCYNFAEYVKNYIPRAKIVGNEEIGDVIVYWGFGEHYWVKIGDKYYGAQTPEGVKNWWDLKYFEELVKYNKYISKDDLKRMKVVGEDLVFDFMDKSWDDVKSKEEFDNIIDLAKKKHPKLFKRFWEMEVKD